MNVTVAPVRETTLRPRRTGAWIPGVVDLSVANHCNATCDFCSFAYDKNVVRQHRFVDRTAVARALQLLRRRGIGYLNFLGGEPLLHPEIVVLVADARRAGLKPSVITNGWKLPERIGALTDVGLQNLLVSIDSADLDAHEHNRGLRGVRRPASGVRRPASGIASRPGWRSRVAPASRRSPR